jgi:A/G-specific adenine glycosylase
VTPPTGSQPLIGAIGTRAATSRDGPGADGLRNKGTTGRDGPAVDHGRRTAALLAWGRATRRELPWRQTRDPWAILVSELMLQQTQVARVVPRYQAFLLRFPDPAACAAAPTAAVVQAWAGLGYNRRAVNLQRAAQRLIECHAGAVPDDLDALLALPGVGPYTARAVRCFAFERDDGIVDTNAARFLARAVAGAPLGPAAVQRLADEQVPAGSGWAWNQAVLDLGALVCVATAPRCEGCPVARDCRWWRAGRPPPDPAVGSAGTSGRQSSFAGSDRQGRGRLVQALRTGPVAATDVAATAGWADDPERARRVVDALVADGLALDLGDHLELPT